MKHISKLKAAAVVAFVLAGGAVAQAITIDTVTVGNPGNAADGNTGYGAVGYTYDIGKYEVTNAQYAAFLNAVAATDTFSLYNANMGSQVFGGITRANGRGNYTYAVKSGYENKPVNYVSFWCATRFANWLNNGQASGSTETGSYTLGGVPNPVNGSAVTRNVGANWVVTSENEWYKAAYYDPNKGGSGVGGYWLHAAQSDTLGNNTAFGATNGANYNDGDYANGGYSGPATTDVGAYSNADSFYGTFDQDGNVLEWNESVSGSSRELRGGSWSAYEIDLRSSKQYAFSAVTVNSNFGFRVASFAPIPEPSTYGSAMGVMALGVVMMRRRKARHPLNF